MSQNRQLKSWEFFVSQIPASMLCCFAAIAEISETTEIDSDSALKFFFFLDRCDMPLGLEDKRVHNKMMRASSYYNYYCGPWNGRLNGRRHGRSGGAWCAKRRDRRQWLQIDFGALAKVYRIASQGRQNSAQWVTSYSLSYSKNGYKFVTYKERGRTKVSSELVIIMFLIHQ